ncbi:class I SAM-dependent methyltransferase [bacterium]|nr:class I SAM-dependent methyltransferase [bacterium]
MHWSERKNSIDDYISPEYYDSIIKDYIFNEKTDLDLFREYVMGKDFDSVLELGCGSGRATDVTVKEVSFRTLTLVDLSRDMINFVSNKYKSKETIKFSKSDHIDYLKNTDNKYDFVYCMWSLSHSIHAHMYRDGEQKGSKDTFETVESFVKNKINENGEMYIFHFDSTSQEQMILLSQWEKAYPLYTDITLQSPSKRTLDKVFEQLTRDNVIEFSCEHYTGKEISYKDEEEYLELFMNFHLETFFNKTELFDDVRSSILSMGEKYKNKDGSYKIKPGCFIYKIKRI